MEHQLPRAFAAGLDLDRGAERLGHLLLETRDIAIDLAGLPGLRGIAGFLLHQRLCIPHREPLGRDPVGELDLAGAFDCQQGPRVTRRSMVLHGMLVNIVNPKGTVFLLAVVPQFIHLSQPLAPQYLAIGATIGFTDLVVMAVYTAMASRVMATLKEPAHMRGLNRVMGSLFVAAGALLAFFKRAA